MSPKREEGLEQGNVGETGAFQCMFMWDVVRSYTVCSCVCVCLCVKERVMWSRVCLCLCDQLTIQGLSFLVVGAFWGCTNPLLKRASAGINKVEGGWLQVIYTF